MRNFEVGEIVRLSSGALVKVLARAEYEGTTRYYTTPPPSSSTCAQFPWAVDADQVGLPSLEEGDRVRVRRAKSVWFHETGTIEAMDKYDISVYLTNFGETVNFEHREGVAESLALLERPEKPKWPTTVEVIGHAVSDGAEYFAVAPKGFEFDYGGSAPDMAHLVRRKR